MYRCYFCLAAFASLMTTHTSVFAEAADKSAAAGAQDRNLDHAANDAGFYTALPAVNSKLLVELLKTYQEVLTQREDEITRYLDENRMDSTDVLITVVMPGGLLYAAARKASLEDARFELTEITKDMDELTRDLLAMQAEAEERAQPRLVQ